MSDIGSSAPSAVSPGEDRGLAYAAYALLIAGLFSGGVGSIIGVIIAATQTSTKDPLLAAHYRHQIRIFWVPVIALGICVVLCFVSYFSGLWPIAALGVFGVIGASVWTAVMAIIGIVRLSENQSVGRVVVGV
jgi:uncharacterized membrane protein